MRRGYFYLLIVAVVIGVSLYGFMGNEGQSKLRNMLPFHHATFVSGATVQFGTTTVSVDVASTPAQMSLGLSGRSSLPSDHGMLFMLGQDSATAFWMKDMKFPLDLIWIHGGTVIDLDANVPVPTTTTLPLYTPISPVNYVVEVNAGFAEAHHINIGSQVVITVDGIRKN